MSQQIQQIVSQFLAEPIEQLSAHGNAGGFSGAQLWQVQVGDERYCLRQWPVPHPTRDRLDWIHRVLIHSKINGCPVAAPLKTTGGSTIVHHAGHFWEFTRWLPGRANFHSVPNDARMFSACDHLARFHLVAAQVSLDFAKSNNVISRIKLLGDVAEFQRQLATITDRTASASLSRLRHAFVAAGEMALRIMAQLRPLAEITFPVQPVIRDIWHDHVLFEEDHVTGIVDFGAMQMDVVSLDVARLLGSLIGDTDPHKFAEAVEHYASKRRLSESERQLIPLLDHSGVILGAMNWLRWLLVEQREFEQIEFVERRIDWLTHRLVHLAEA